MNQHNEPYYVIDPTKIKDAYNLWRQNLPEVDLYYAMKCNPNKIILKEMHKLGIKFDCASKQEIIDALQFTTSDNIIYANPCKVPHHVSYAKECGVSLTVVDCECEMYKMKELYPESKILLRIAVNDENSQCAFSKKFGCKMNDIKNLLILSKTLQLNIVGFSFHVGSGCTNPELFYEALCDCKTSSIIASSLGIQIEIIDIGGGFNQSNFIECSNQVQKGMKLFGENTKTFISEVGRFLVEQSHTLYLHVISKKINNEIIYYLDDGVYGSFGCKIFDHAKPILKTNKDAEPKFNSTVYGPTCDSFDLIDENILLPELNVGDIVYIENFGAYTSASASSFNGYKVNNFIIKKS
jgi:ornithine decarboxylase